MTVSSRFSTAVVGLTVAVLAASPAYAQNTTGSVGQDVVQDGTSQVDLAVHSGSMGLGVDVAVLVQPTVGLRASLNYIPFDVSFEDEGVDYSLDWATPQFLLLADYYVAGRFRLSGGVMISTKDFEMSGGLTEPTEFGDQIYTPQEVGDITGTITTNAVSPYVGIGFGNPATSRIGFFMDLGVAFHGNPELSAQADGTAALDPQFQQDFDTEVEELQDDVDNVIVYPVLSLGVSFRLGA